MLQSGSGKFCAERFNALTPVEPLLQLGGMLCGPDENGTKPPTVIKAHLHTIFQQQAKMIMSRPWSIPRKKTNLAGHAKMQDQNAAAGHSDQKVLGPSIHGMHTISGYRRTQQLARNGRTQPLIAPGNSSNLSTRQMGQQPSACDFNFR